MNNKVKTMRGNNEQNRKKKKCNRRKTKHYERRKWSETVNRNKGELQARGGKRKQR